MKSTDPPDKDYKLLIIRFLSGELTPSEESELHDWINSDPENASLFVSYRTTWLTTTGFVDQNVFNKERAWNSIAGKLETVPVNLENEDVRGIRSHSLLQVLKVAALILFVFLLGGISSFFIFSFSGSASRTSCIVSTPLGSMTYMVLPDNSQVWLNAGSTLTYPQTFDRDKRQVKLRGEAFFKVKSDKSKPFIVNTGQYNIKALGTSFNVKAYPEDSYISTTLVEGTININGLGSRRGFSYTLRPNQNLTIPLAKKKNEPITDIKNEPVIRHDDNAALKPRVSMSSVIKTEAMVSWKDRRWTIQGEPLGSLAVLLGRRFNTNIHVSSELLGRYKFSGIIQNETLEQVLQYLRYTTPLKYEIGKGEVWWDIDPDLAKKYSKILNK